MIIHPEGSLGLQLGEGLLQQNLLLRGQTVGEAVLPIFHQLFKPGKQFHGLFRGIQAHDPLVFGAGAAGDKAALLQNHHLPGDIALVNADALGKLILGYARLGTDLGQIAGVAALQPHGGKNLRTVLGTAAGDFGHITDDLRHGQARLHAGYATILPRSGGNVKFFSVQAERQKNGIRPPGLGKLQGEGDR